MIYLSLMWFRFYDLYRYDIPRDKTIPWKIFKENFSENFHANWQQIRLDDLQAEIKDDLSVYLFHVIFIFTFAILFVTVCEVIIAREKIINSLPFSS